MGLGWSGLICVVVWVPDSSFSDVYFYLASNRGNLRYVAVTSLCFRCLSGHHAADIHSPPHDSVLVHPLTADQRRDHELRNGWMGTPWPIYLDSLPSGGAIPLQYPELGLGWSTSPTQEVSLEERRKRGAEVERVLKGDPEAAPAPEE